MTCLIQFKRQLSCLVFWALATAWISPSLSGAEEVARTPLPAGYTFPHGDGHLHVVLESPGRFRVLFFDEEWQPAPVPFHRGVARVQPAARRPETLTLAADGNGGLVSAGFVRPPHVFLVRVSLFATESEEESRLLTFQYNQHSLPPDPRDQAK